MTLASRGGRNSTSTEIPVIGGSDQYRGLAPAPFFISPIHLTFHLIVIKFLSFLLPLTGPIVACGVPKKSERPVGVPAALAWGMEGLLSEDQSFSGVAGCSTALSSRRTTHRSKIIRIIPPLPNTEPNSRSRKRFCRTPWIASLGWKVHLGQYSALALPYLYQSGIGAGRKEMSRRHGASNASLATPYSPTLCS